MPSREGLRSPGRKVNPEGLCAPKKQPERERERKRKKDTGTRQEESFHKIRIVVTNRRKELISRVSAEDS